MEPDSEEIALKRLQNEKDMLTKVKPERGVNFVNMVKDVLINYSNIKKDYVNIIFDNPKYIKLYENAFTSNTVNSFKNDDIEKVVEDENSTDNNSIYKFYGDNIFENFMVWYLFRKFPSLRSSNDVKIIARLKINYGPKIVFPIFAKKYNFIDYTWSSLFERERTENSLIQNVFSALLGVTSIIFDEECSMNGVGYSVCYEILKNFFEDIDLKLPSKFEELDNPITTLKQFFDKNKYRIGMDLNGYDCEQDRVNNVYNCIVNFIKDRTIIKAGNGTSHLKKDAQKLAAINALQFLENKGYSLDTKSNKPKNIITNITRGNRTISFKKFLENIFNESNIKDKYKNILLSDDSMKIFDIAFTSNTANVNEYGEQDEDSTQNYEIYENLGDAIFKNFIGYYSIKRFDFKEYKDVKILSRIKINYGSKVEFSKIGKQMGFLPFITASEIEHSTRQKALLEDTFESFFGAVGFILDNKIKIGVGYSIAYSILENIFNKIDIPINIEDLKDPISVLKEFVDKNKDFGIIEYHCGRYGDLVKCNTVVNGSILGSGTGAINSTAKQNAALNTIEILKRRGFKL
jgi:dsRNA-specific ribonuclease